MGGNLVKIVVDTSAVAPMAAWLRERTRGNADEARPRDIPAAARSRGKTGFRRAMNRRRCAKGVRPAT